MATLYDSVTLEQARLSAEHSTAVSQPAAAVAAKVEADRRAVALGDKNSLLEKERVGSVRLRIYFAL